MSPVGIVAAAWVLVEFGGLRITRVRWRHFILRREICGWLSLQIVDDRLNDGLGLRGVCRMLKSLSRRCFGMLFSHGARPFCPRF